MHNNTNDNLQTMINILLKKKKGIWKERETNRTQNNSTWMDSLIFLKMFEVANS
jgi:hypothetical protein